MGLAVLTSCSPEKESKDFDVTNISADQLLSGATFKQMAAILDEEGNITGYTDAPDGNYIEYNIPGVSAVNIFTKDADGAETQLMNTVTQSFTHSGGGMFSLIPRRGSDPNQTVFFRYTNQDGKDVEASTTFNVYVPSDIAYELKLIASNDYGKKVWKWDPSITGTVWGNMGYQPGSGASVGLTGNGQWWGIDSSEEFNNQLQHSPDQTNHGDGDFDAYMEISEDGKIKSYAADGTLIREGTFKIENFNNSDPEAWKVGDLKTDAILWPWIINTNGKLPSEANWGPKAYEICYLTPDKMTLVYPGGNAETGEANGGWGEATYWHFCSTSDLIGMSAGYAEGKDWTWDTSVSGTAWGNMGYQPGDGASVGTAGNGQWWGVTSTAEFADQLQHSAGQTAHGDGDLDAYMTIGTDGKIYSYSANGSLIRSGTYEFQAVSGSTWKIANLKTDAILWPWIINTNAKMPSEVNWGPGAYEVVYLTSDKMTLVYPGGNGETGAVNGAWGEATYWHFKAK